MSEVPSSTDYRHFVSLNKFDQSIERIMEFVWKIVGSRKESSLFPTLIGINIDSRCTEKQALLFRAFLDRLGKLHGKHFVRFIVDVHWAMVSDSGHLFYTHDGPKENRCDIVWTLGAASDVQIELTMNAPHNPQRRDLLADLSKNLKKFIPCPTTNDGRILFRRLLHFYNNTERLECIHHMAENVHILLLPTEESNGFYPVPIYGMSYFDGARRESRMAQWANFHKKCHDKILTHDQDAGHTVYALLDLIRENADFGITLNYIHETYNLAEMIFAIWAVNHDGDESNHDILLFNAGNREERDTTVFSYPMGSDL